MESGGVPADLIREILSHLPLRSLVRFRIVCREWNSIMDEPHFIAAHLDRSKSLPPAITIVAYYDGIYNTIYLDNGGDPSPASTKPISMGSSRLAPTNSINGILCIPHDDGAIELLNPATEESLILRSNFGEGIIPYLGFCPETKEYKIVCFVENYACLSTQCEVYTVSSHGTGSWRRIQDFQFDFFDYVWGGICIEGKLYWITQDDRTLGYRTITTLDLATEKFSDIVISNFHPFVKKQDIDFCFRGILELEGKLCVVVWQPDTELGSSSGGDLYFYVLGDDGGWVEKASFNIPWEDCRATPLMIHKGKVYVKSYFDALLTGLCMIHLESRNWSEICAHMMVSSFYVSFFAHGESLVSPRNL